MAILPSRRTAQIVVERIFIQARYSPPGVEVAAVEALAGC
jgi:hypothetical protein